MGQGEKANGWSVRSPNVGTEDSLRSQRGIENADTGSKAKRSIVIGWEEHGFMKAVRCQGPGCFHYCWKSRMAGVPKYRFFDMGIH